MKNLFYLLSLGVIFTSCKPTSVIITSKKEAIARGVYSNYSSEKSTSKKENKNNKNKSSNYKDSESSNSLANQIINSATENLGAPYKMAGKTKSGYDCSGLVYATFNIYDIKLPRTSIEQSKTGALLGVNIEDAKKGDLIFFKTNNSSKINHVGIVTEVNDSEIKFIHSSTSKGVIISSTAETYYQNTFAQLNRILE